MFIINYCYYLFTVYLLSFIKLQSMDAVEKF